MVRPTCWSGDSEDLGAAALEVVRLLLDYGADLEAKDEDRRTPLFYTLDGYATKRVIKDVGEWATDGPASVPARNSLDEKVYDVAVEVYNLMVQRGADARVRDDNGKSVIDLINTNKFFVDNVGLISSRPQWPRNTVVTTLPSRGRDGKGGNRGNGRGTSRGK